MRSPVLARCVLLLTCLLSSLSVFSKTADCSKNTPVFSAKYDNQIITSCLNSNENTFSAGLTESIYTDSFNIEFMEEGSSAFTEPVNISCVKSTNPRVFDIPYPEKRGVYRLYAFKDGCKSEPLTLTVETVRETPVIDNIPSMVLCMTEYPEFNIVLKSGEANCFEITGLGPISNGPKVISLDSPVTEYFFENKSVPAGEVTSQKIGVKAIHYFSEDKTKDYCFSTKSISAWFEDTLSVDIRADADVICEGESVLLSLDKHLSNNTGATFASQKYTITDDHGGEYVDFINHQVSPIQTTTYTVEAVSEICKMTKKASVTVEVDPLCEKKKSDCEAPVFDTDGSILRMCIPVHSIFDPTPPVIHFEITQLNDVAVDSFMYRYDFGADIIISSLLHKSFRVQKDPEKEGNKWIFDLPFPPSLDAYHKDFGRLTLFAKSGDCDSRKFVINVEVGDSLEFFNELEDKTFCEGETPVVLVRGTIKDKVPTQSRIEMLVVKTESSYKEIVGDGGSGSPGFTVDGFDPKTTKYLDLQLFNHGCTSEEVRINIDYEELPSFEFAAESELVCEGKPTVLTLEKKTAPESEANYTYTITDDAGNEYADASTIEVSPTKKTTYTVEAVGKHCATPVTSSVTVDIDPSCEEECVDPVIKPLADVMMCENENVILTVELESGKAEDLLFLGDGWIIEMKSDNETGYSGKVDVDLKMTANKLLSMFVSESMTLVANQGDCQSQPITFKIGYEELPSFEFAAESELVCEGKPTVLTLEKKTAPESEANYTYTITDDAGNKYADASTIEVSPTKKTTYTVEAVGKHCATPVSSSVTVDIDPSCEEECVDPVIKPLADVMMCENENVILTVELESGKAENLLFEGDGWSLDMKSDNETGYSGKVDVDLNMTANMLLSESVTLVAKQGDCQSQPITFKIGYEELPSFEFAAESELVCEGKPTVLTLEKKTAPESEANYTYTITDDAGNKYADASTIEVSPTKKTTYTVEAVGKHCATPVSSSVTVDIDPSCDEECVDPVIKPLADVMMCENENVILTVELESGKAENLLFEGDGWSLDMKSDNETGYSGKVDVDLNMTANMLLSESVTLVAKQGDCQSQPITFMIGYEELPSFEFAAESELVCEGKPTVLTFEKKTAPESEANYTYTITDDAGNKYADASTIEVSPTKKTTYTVEAVGKHCATPVSSSVTVDIDPSCEEECVDPVIKPLADMTFCEDANPEFVVKIENGKADRLIFSSPESSAVQFEKTSTELVSEFLIDDLVFTAKHLSSSMISVVAENGKCVSKPVQFKINYEDIPSFDFAAEKTSVCEGESTVLTLVKKTTSEAINDHIYTITDDAGNKYADASTIKVSPVKKTTYTVEAVSKYCGSEKSFVDVDVNEIPEMTLDVSDTRVCEDDKVTIQAKFSKDNVDESSIVWTKKEYGSSSVSEENTSVQTIIVTPSVQTAYTLTAKTSEGCDIPAVSSTIEVDEKIIAEIEDVVACEGQRVLMEIEAPKSYSYEWTSADDITKVLSLSHQYSTDAVESKHMVVKITNGVCEKTMEALLTVVSNPVIDKVECDEKRNELIVSASEGTGRLTYDFGNGEQEDNVLSDFSRGMLYKIVVKDEYECMADTTFRAALYDLEIPAFFTPNEDGENDTWKIKNIDMYPNSTVTIYDRWGKKLAEEDGRNFDGWDGTYNGTALPSTDYWYVISLNEIDKTYTGHFTLIRK